MPVGVAAGIDQHLDLRRLEVKRAPFLALAAQRAVHVVKAVDDRREPGLAAREPLAALEVRGDAGVGEARLRAHHRVVEAAFRDAA
jgi:hypothetical protein